MAQSPSERRIFLRSFVPDAAVARGVVGVRGVPSLVLIADLSGWSALADWLVTRLEDAELAAEALSQRLNTYLAPLIDVIVTEYAGDILKFAGDAIIAAWAEDDFATAAEAARHVAECAAACTRVVDALNEPPAELLGSMPSVPWWRTAASETRNRRATDADSTSRSRSLSTVHGRSREDCASEPAGTDGSIPRIGPPNPANPTSPTSKTSRSSLWHKESQQDLVVPVASPSSRRESLWRKSHTDLDASSVESRSRGDTVASEREPSLSLHSAIAMGPAVAVVCRCPHSQRREFVLSAVRIFRELGSAVARSRPGEVILSASVAPFLVHVSDEIASTEERKLLLGMCTDGPQTLYRLAEASRSLDVGPRDLERFVPASVLRVAEGGTLSTAELRRVAVAFVDLAVASKVEAFGTPQAERAIAVLLKDAIESAMEIVHRTSGHVRQVTMDDKCPGLLIAVWGLPPHVSAEDPSRALHGTLEIVEALEGARGAVTTGKVFCGFVGSDKRREYAIVGDTINVCARQLALAGPGEVLCDGRTAAAADKRTMRVEELPKVTVKGKSDMIRIFRARLGASEQAFVSSRLPPRTCVARDHEKQVIREFVEAHPGVGPQAADPAQPSVLVLEAPAGMGKSVLVQFAAETHASDAAFHVGGGDANEQTTPYFAWTGIFRQLLRIEAGSAQVNQARVLDFVQSRLGVDYGSDPLELRYASRVSENTRELPGVDALQAMQTRYGRLVPLLNDVLPELEFADNGFTRTATGPTRSDNLAALLLHILRTASDNANGRVLFVIEDLHWVDTLSWKLLTDIASNRLVRVLCTTRPWAEVVERERYVALKHAAGTRILRVQPFSAGDCKQAMQATLGVATVDDGVARLLCKETGGSPFFLREHVGFLVDRELLVVVQGALCLAPGLPPEALQEQLPETLEVSVSASLGKLSGAAEVVIKVAAVAGHHFVTGLLAAMHPSETIGVDEIEARLEEARDLGLVTGSGSAWEFRHVIFRGVAYRQIVRSERQVFHGRAARYLAEHGGSASLLAHHYFEAGDYRAAVAQLGEAGRVSAATSAHNDVLRMFGQALALAEEHGIEIERRELATWYRLCGEAAVLLGRSSQAVAELREALRHMGRAWTPQGLRSVFGIVQGMGQQIVSRVGRRVGVASAEEQAEAEQASAVYERLVEASHFLVKPWMTINALLKQLNTIEAYSSVRAPHPLEVRGLFEVAIAGRLVGLTRVAARYRRRAIARLATLEQLDAGAQGSDPVFVHVMAGVCDGSYGYPRDARDRLWHATQMAMELGDMRRLAEAVPLCMVSEEIVGDRQHTFDELLDLVWESAQHRDDQQAKVWAACLSASLSVRNSEHASDKAGTVRERMLIVQSFEAARLLRSDRVLMGIAGYALDDLELMRISVKAIETRVAMASYVSLGMFAVAGMLRRVARDGERSLLPEIQRALRWWAVQARAYAVSRAQHQRMVAYLWILRNHPRRARRALQRAIKVTNEYTQLCWDRAAAVFERNRLDGTETSESDREVYAAAKFNPERWSGVSVVP